MNTTLFKILRLSYRFQVVPPKYYSAFNSWSATMSNITDSSLSEKLRKNLNIEHLEIIDESSCNCGLKFRATIVSDDFKGKPLLARHRLVNSILEEELKSIHAFSQDTLTVEQWNKLKS